MRENLGEIKFNEHGLSDSGLQRFVDDKMRQWLKSEGLAEGPTDYEVSFFDEDVLGEVSCMIAVHCGSKSWRSWESADNPRTAFFRSIENLHGDSELEH